MNKKLGVGLTMAAMVAAAGLVMTTTDAEAGRGDGPVIFVTSQRLYFDSIVTRDPLPPHGPFQLLEMGANGLQTEFGPGDVGYVGGRWMEDIDGDGELHYFSCPLLGPGRENP